YAITGNSIDEGLEVDESQIDYNERRIPLAWVSHRGQRYDWLLIPLRPFDEVNERNALDKLLVFEPPREGRDYSCGIDTADGLGKMQQDGGVIHVMGRGKRSDPDMRVGVFPPNRNTPPQTVGFAAALGAWYGPVCRDPRGVKFCIEQRERPGD